ncbi:hypothetical protein C0J52_09079 [Blattella germanica]|nr:hypothetical protein C0J52_09079 [Blattella germanica]
MLQAKTPAEINQRGTYEYSNKKEKVEMDWAIACQRETVIVLESSGLEEKRKVRKIMAKMSGRGIKERRKDVE